MPIEKREQVFVSSTYIDLADERQEVIQTLLEADCIPAGMELFPASTEERWSLIKRVIDDSDYYLVVVGGRYGSVDPSTDLSYTEMEFDYAVTQEKPILGFLHRDPGEISATKTELDAALREKLDAFRTKVGERMVKFWRGPEDLGAQVAKSLIQIRKTHPVDGWVRAADAIPPEVATELAELRAKVAEMSSRQASTTTGARAAHDLAGGDDETEITGFVYYWDSDQVDTGRMYSHNRHTAEMTFSTTWNEIFGRVGVIMFEEASERQIDDELDGLAIDSLDTAVVENADEIAKIGKTEVNKYAIQDVIVQLFSLGLITQSTKRHPISDKNKYWTLTDEGRDALLRLRAVRKSLATGGAEKAPGPASEE